MSYSLSLNALGTDKKESLHTVHTSYFVQATFTNTRKCSTGTHTVSGNSQDIKPRVSYLTSYVYMYKNIY